MHTCVAAIHTIPEITMGCEGHVHFRERKLPLWVGACCAVRARRARALEGAWACLALGREGRARWVGAGERLLVGGRVWHALGAAEWPVRICAWAFWVLGPSRTAAHARFCAHSGGAGCPAMSSRLVGPAGPCAMCIVLLGAVFCRMLCVLQYRGVLCAALWSGRAWCGVWCRVLACGGGASRACCVLGACGAARRPGVGPPSRFW